MAVALSYLIPSHCDDRQRHLRRPDQARPGGKLTRDFRRRHAEQADSINVRFGRAPGGLLDPGEVLPPSLEASPDDVRAANSGLLPDIQDDSSLDGLGS